MFKHLSLRTRVSLVIAAVLTLVVAIGGFVTIDHVRQSVAEETRSALQLAKEMVEASHLQGPLNRERVRTWAEMLERLNQARHVHLFLLPEEQMHPPQPPSSIPEVPDWFSRLVHPPQLFVEQYIPTETGRPLRVVLVADPSDEITEAWEETRVFLGLLLLLAGSCFAAIYWILGRAFQPVDQVLEGLIALEREQYRHRLPDFPQPEWDRIARAFNHCAAELEYARKENRNLTRQLLKVEEEERRTLAQELHDELGQVLSGIKMLALSIKKHQPTDPVYQAACLIADEVDRLFAIVRGMIHRLRPLMLDDLGLAAAIDTLIAGWRQHQPSVRIVLDCDPVVNQLPGEHRIHVYRIVQEAVTNAFKHGHPRTIHLRLKQTCSTAPKHRWLEIEIRDDGVGADLTHAPSQGYGLRGMQERVASLGGQLDITTAVGQGFTLKILLPIEEENEDDRPRHACR